jgi:hypothetical protein
MKLFLDMCGLTKKPYKFVYDNKFTEIKLFNRIFQSSTVFDIMITLINIKNGTKKEKDFSFQIQDIDKRTIHIIKSIKIREIIIMNSRHNYDFSNLYAFYNVYSSFIYVLNLKTKIFFFFCPVFYIYKCDHIF